MSVTTESDIYQDLEWYGKKHKLGFCSGEGEPFEIRSLICDLDYLSTLDDNNELKKIMLKEFYFDRRNYGGEYGQRHPSIPKGEELVVLGIGNYDEVFEREHKIIWTIPKRFIDFYMEEIKKNNARVLAIQKPEDLFINDSVINDGGVVMEEYVIETLKDLAIVDSDIPIIKDDKRETIMDFKNNYCSTLMNLMSFIEKCRSDIKEENVMSNVQILLNPLGRMLKKAVNNDMNSYFEDVVVSAHTIIKDFQYDYFVDILRRSYRFYLSAKRRDSSDKYILFYIFDAFKKAAYNLGIRSCNVDTLKKAVMLDESLWYTAPIEDTVISEEDFEEEYGNDSGIGIRSIPYYVDLTTVYPVGPKTERYNFSKGTAYYLQSVHDELTEAYEKNRKM